MMRAHGVWRSDDELHGGLAIGILPLLEWVEREFGVFAPLQCRQQWPYSRPDRRFLSAVDGLRSTINKLNRAAELYSYNLATSTLGNPRIGSPISEVAVWTRALQDLEINVDSILIYLRRQADLLADCIPYFYSEAIRGQVPCNSFNAQSKWFLKHPDIDPAYAAILEQNLSWFTKIKDLRDTTIHQRSGYQTTFRLGDSGAFADPRVTMSRDFRSFSNDLETDIKSGVSGFFAFLDLFQHHLVFRIGPVIAVEGLPTTLQQLTLLQFQQDAVPAFLWAFPEVPGP